MLIKWLSQKVIENLISEALKQLPEIKDKLLNDLALHKDEIIKGALEKAKEAVIDFLKKRVGK